MAEKRQRWGLGPTLIVLLVLAAILILVAIVSYLMDMDSVPTHPDQNGSIIEVEPEADRAITEVAKGRTGIRAPSGVANPKSPVLPA